VKRILPILMVGILGAGAAAAQTSASAQAGASGQSQTSTQTTTSGSQASGNASGSTSTSASSNTGTTQIPSGTKIDATLTHSLDAKTNKPGDRVEAVTARDVKQDGKVVLKRGSRLIGHVTEAQARTKDNAQSQLGIVFDHAMTAKGETVPLSATIQALAAAHTATEAQDDFISSGGVAGGTSGATNSRGTLSGVTSTVGATAGSVANTPNLATGTAEGTLANATKSEGAVGGLTSTGRLASNSSGVFGIQGLSLNSATSSATTGSLIVSPTKSVHLENGTQMLLSVTGSAHEK
jgi:hypothetical protein